MARVDLPLRIVDLGLRGDDAVAVALYEDHPDPSWQRSIVVLRRTDGGWVGVGYGSGLELPDWYRCAAPPTPAPSTTADAWAGVWQWEEPGFRHGSERHDAIYSGWMWTLELEAGAGGVEGRLAVDGLQVAEEYRVRLEGDVEEARIVFVEAVEPPRGAGPAPGDTLLTLYRAGDQVLTRFDALAPFGEPAADPSKGEGAVGWAVRFRR